MCRKVERETSKPLRFAYRREGASRLLRSHNNTPKILYTLNLISPSLKIDHSALQERLRFVLCLVGSYLLYSFQNSRSKDRLFFVLGFGIVKINFLFSIYKQNRRSTKKNRPSRTKKKGGGGKKKNGGPPKKKIAPPKTKI